MKYLLLVPLFIASIPNLPPGPPPEKINIGDKPYVELLGAGSARITISSVKDHQGVQVSFPESGTKTFVHFQSGKLGGAFYQSRVGDLKTVLFDNIGDGLPTVRHTIQILPNGEEKLIKIERLAWTSSESKE